MALTIYLEPRNKDCSLVQYNLVFLGKSYTRKINFKHSGTAS